MKFYRIPCARSGTRDTRTPTSVVNASRVISTIAPVLFVLTSGLTFAGEPQSDAVSQFVDTVMVGRHVYGRQQQKGVVEVGDDKAAIDRFIASVLVPNPKSIAPAVDAEMNAQVRSAQEQFIQDVLQRR